MERNKKVLNVAELREVVNSIFLHIENDLGVKEVELTEDYYWNIADEVLYMGDNIEGEVTVGSLHADLDFLHPLVNDKAQAFPLMLIHVAPLLRFMAMRTPANKTTGSDV